MGRLVWNDPTKRRLEGGTDRGVLYLSGRSGVPWDGITSVTQRNTMEADHLFFDGRKFAIDTIPGSFEGTLSAFNYPPEFEAAQGFEEVRPGVFAGSQRPVPFGLTYRTLIQDADGQDVGYVIHIFWNLYAVPSDITHNTLGGTTELAPFSWDISAVAVDLPGIAPTAHLSFKTTDVDPWLIEDIEAILYGSEAADAILPPLEVFYQGVIDWARFWITVNGDTWTGTEARSGHIFPIGDGTDVRIDQANVSFIDEDTFVLENVYNLQDVTAITVRDNGDGTVTMTSDEPGAIVDAGGGDFNLPDVELLLSGDGMFRIETTNPPR